MKILARSVQVAGADTYTISIDDGLLDVEDCVDQTSIRLTIADAKGVTEEMLRMIHQFEADQEGNA